MKILAMTVCCMDIYAQQSIKCIGGNSVNFATQCVQSGVRQVALLGGIGNDAYGAEIKNHLRKYTIDVSHLYTMEGVTASNKIYITETGERTFRPDSWNGGVYEIFRLSPEDWDFMRTFDIVAMPCLDPNFPEALNRLSPSNKFVVDFLDTRDFNRMENALPKMDIAFISGDAEVIEIVKPLSEKYGKLIVVTLGAEGSVAVLNGKTYSHGAVAVDNVIDTTGCGDAYQAAFTISWFRDHDLNAAMEAGAVAASRILSHFGGV